MADSYALKIASAVVISGEIKRPGEIVFVNESVAKMLLGNGKAEVAADQVAPQPQPQPQPEAKPEPTEADPAADTDTGKKSK